MQRRPAALHHRNVGGEEPELAVKPVGVGCAERNSPFPCAGPVTLSKWWQPERGRLNSPHCGATWHRGACCAECKCLATKEGPTYCVIPRRCAGLILCR